MKQFLPEAAVKKLLLDAAQQQRMETGV